MKDKTESERPFLLAFLLNLGFVFAAVWPLLELWNWIAVPQLHAPPLRYAEMFGLVQLWRLLIWRSSPRELSDIEKLSESLDVCLSCYLALGITWMLLHG